MNIVCWGRRIFDMFRIFPSMIGWALRTWGFFGGLDNKQLNDPEVQNPKPSDLGDYDGGR